MRKPNHFKQAGKMIFAGAVIALLIICIIGYSILNGQYWLNLVWAVPFVYLVFVMMQNTNENKI
jgi:hypothetical protein